MLSAEKITPRHREPRAYVYIRQSSPKQVLHNRESQANQYALVERALSLGWVPERVHVLDADLGESGQDRDRPGFRELVASAVATGLLAELAQPTLIGQRRIPGLELHDDRVIRLLETLLHPGGFVANWTTRELQARILARHQLVQTAYRLSQLRYDPAKLRAVLPDQVRLSHSVSGQDQKATGAVNIVTLHGILT